MPYSTDRQYVERLLIPAMMQTIVTVMRKDIGPDLVLFDPVAELLTAALKEPIESMPPERAHKILRRAQRTTTEAMQVMADRGIGVQFLAIAYLTVDLTRRDVLAVGQCSAFAQAWDMIAEVMGVAVDELSLDEGGLAAAADLGRHLLACGFFRST